MRKLQFAILQNKRMIKAFRKINKEQKSKGLADEEKEINVYHPFMREKEYLLLKRKNKNLVTLILKTSTSNYFIGVMYR